MSDGVNNFFESVSGRLGNALGNPVAGQRPQITGPTVSGSRSDNNSLLSLSETRRDGVASLQKPGFAPIQYYRRGVGEDSIVEILPVGDLRSTEESLQQMKDQFSLQKNGEVTSQGEGSGDRRLGDFRFSLDEFSKFMSEQSDFFASDGSNQREMIISEYLNDQENKIRYHDNEDPVYFGFEVVMNDLTSPLFNGKVDEFIEDLGENISEIQDLSDSYNQFKKEIRRYFKLKSDLNNSQQTQVGDNVIFETSNDRRRYYVKKINGLDLLIEKNAGDVKKSFIEYNKDKIDLTFFEDTTLNLGTLASLYKSFYWSRNHGKSLIPENLLRFDCEIIVSELRNFSRIRKTDDFLNEVRSNLSRYVYKVYECQFFFDKMTHPNEVDMSSGPNATFDYTIPFTFKHSNMIFERWNPVSELWGTVRNDTFYSDDQSRSVTDSFKDPIDVDKIYDRNIQYDWKGLESVGDSTEEQEDQSTIESEEKSRKARLKEIFKNSGKNLVEDIKDTALREAQRQLNIRFRLLNDSLDRIRNQFGIGRIPAPTNVYFPRQNTGPYGQSTVFFDVQNSLRNFGGDILTGLIGGG